MCECKTKCGLIIWKLSWLQYIYQTNTKYDTNSKLSISILLQSCPGGGGGPVKGGLVLSRGVVVLCREDILDILCNKAPFNSKQVPPPVSDCKKS